MGILEVIGYLCRVVKEELYNLRENQFFDANSERSSNLFCDLIKLSKVLGGVRCGGEDVV